MKLNLSHILVTHLFEAQDLERKLAAGGDFAELARRFSKCASAPQGGALGLIDLRRLDEDFAEAARALKPGQVSGPIRTRFGHHLIWRHANSQEQ